MVDINYVEKVVNIDQTHNLGIRRTELKSIVAVLKQNKADFDNEDQWLSAVDSIMMSVRNNPLEKELDKKRALAQNQICPVCQNQMESITLMRDRPAYYCEVHKIVSPEVVDMEDPVLGK